MVVFYDEVEKPSIDMAEIYRQDFLDARDRVHDLEYENEELRMRIKFLENQLEKLSK